MNKKEISTEKKALIFVLIVLMYFFYRLMTPFLMSFVVSAIIAILTYPLYQRLNHGLKNKPRLAALLMTLGFVVLIILPISFLATVLIDQSYGLVDTLNLRQTFSELFSNEFYLKFIAPFVNDFEQKFHFKLDLLGILTQIGKKAAATVYNFSPKILLGTAGFLFHFFLMVVVLYFLYFEGPYLVKLLLDLSPLRTTHERRLLRQFKITIDASVYGYLLTALVQGIIASVVFLITGLQGFLILTPLFSPLHRRSH